MSEPRDPLPKAEVLRDIADHFQMIRFEAAESMDGEQLAFIEALCDAGERVSLPAAKMAAKTLAVGALGGPESLQRLIPFLRQWCAFEQSREAAEKLGQKPEGGG